MSNSLLILRPYKLHGSWVFDDERYGLVREPFVCGASEMIDDLTRGMPGAEKGFRLLFSASAFPGHQRNYQWLRDESGGNWYRDEQTGMEGWLCPALFHYFETAPQRIYAKAEPQAP